MEIENIMYISFAILCFIISIWIGSYIPNMYISGQRKVAIIMCIPCLVLIAFAVYLIIQAFTNNKKSNKK